MNSSRIVEDIFSGFFLCEDYKKGKTRPLPLPADPPLMHSGLIFKTPSSLEKLPYIPRNDKGAGGGQNTDPQSKDYPNGLPKWTTLKWTTPKNTISDYILTLHDLRGLQPPF